MLPSQGSLRLPIEVIENVIDQATCHTQTLRSFALTCHEFLPRSRYHLFRGIILRSMTQLHSFYKFLKLNPHVRSFVTSLTLSTTQDEPQTLSLLQIIPMPLFDRLPNLCKWAITDPDTVYRKPPKLLSFPLPTLECLTEYGTKISTLELNRVSFSSCTHFVDYILAFQYLDMLSCYFLCFEIELDDMRLHSIKQRLAGRLRLIILTISGVPDDAALVLLESSRSTLECLVLFVERETNVEEEITFDLPSVVSELNELRCLNLQLCPHESDDKGTICENVVLRTFKIIEALSFRRESHLETLIVGLVDTQISSLLCMLSKPDSYPNLECFSELESILLRFPNLRKIEVRHDTPRHIDWTSVLEDYLPKLAAATQTMMRLKLLPLMSNHRQASHDDAVQSISVSPDSKWIASSSRDYTIILWDAQRRSIVHEWIAHWRCPGPVSSLAFSPDSRHLASTGGDGKVIVWDISGSGVKRIATLEGHSDKVNTCAWSPDGTRLVSGSDDGTVRIWDTVTYQQRCSLQGPSCESIWFVRFSPDGRWIVSGGRGTSDCDVWDVAAAHLHVVPVRFLRGHNKILHNAVFDLATGRIATASLDHAVRIWDVETGDVCVMLEGHTDWVIDVAFSPDGAHVVSGSHDKTVKVWDSFSGDLLLSLEAHTDAVRAVCFSPDGTYIASASWDKTVRLWRASDGACIRSFTEHTNAIRCLVFSPDGETLTSGGNDGNVFIRPLCDVVLPEERSEADGPVQNE